MMKIKKLSIIFTLASVFSLMSGITAAADFDMVVSNISPPSGSTITVEIKVDGWEGTELQTFDFCLRYDSTVLDVNSMQINDTSDGGCAAATFSISVDNDSDCARLGGGIFPGTTCNVADDYLLATVVFDVLTTNGTEICASCDCQSADGCGHGFDGYVEDETGWQYPAEVCADISGGAEPTTSSTLFSTTSVPQPHTTTTTSTVTTSSSIKSSTSTTTIISDTTTTPANICVFDVIYGETSTEVQVLRFIRDNVLKKTSEGQEIIRLYYQWSPVILKAMEGNKEFKEEVKEIIDRFMLLINAEVE